jgi:signal peptidase II
MTRPPSTRSRRAPFLVAGAVVLLDQLSKAWAVAALSDGPIRLAGDVLALRLTRNPGGAFSLLTGFTPVLALLAAVMTVVIVRTTRRTDDPLAAYSLALVLGGAVGNLIDRLVRDPGFLRGEVVDFIDLSFWPTFNLADSAITVGVLLVVIRGWRVG